MSILLSENETDAIKEILESRREFIKSGNQGSSLDYILGEDIVDRISKVKPDITYVGLNYYDCDGKIVAAISLGNKTTKFIRTPYSNNLRGFKINTSSDAVSRRHLSKYETLR